MDEIAEKGYAAHWHYKNEGIQRNQVVLIFGLVKLVNLLENPECKRNRIYVDDFQIKFIFR